MRKKILNQYMFFSSYKLMLSTNLISIFIHHEIAKPILHVKFIYIHMVYEKSKYMYNKTISVDKLFKDVIKNR